MNIGFDISQTGSGKAGCGYYTHAMIKAMARGRSAALLRRSIQALEIISSMPGCRSRTRIAASM